MKSSAHILLIDNAEEIPKLYLVQERNKHWGSIGGGVEKKDNNSFERAAVRELSEETAGSLKGNIKFFKFLDSYEIRIYPNLLNLI